jgi:hypothetical protein
VCFLHACMLSLLCNIWVPLVLLLLLLLLLLLW